MLSMSSSDFIVSGAWFCTTWPIPRDELQIDDPSERLYGNVGNQQTCTAQAFFIQLGIVTPFYNAILALYYYLTIRREWKEEEFKCRVEYAGHFLSIAWGLGTAIAGLVMDLFNNSGVWCWIAPYPSGCGDGPNQDPCVRGENASTYRWAFYYGPLWVMIFLVALFMSLVYAYVRGLDNKMDQYTATYRNNAAAAAAARPSNDSGSGELGPGGRRKSLMARTFSTVNTDTLNEQRRQRRNERSKAVANQGLFYAGTFALVWVFGTIVRAMQLAGAKPPWAIVFLFAVFTPSQGFFNFLVYVRPRLIKLYEERKKKMAGKRNSKTGSSFNSDILHVSGISGHGSSSEALNETRRDASTRSDLELSEPFQKSEPFETPAAAPVASPVASPVATPAATPEPKPPRRTGTPGFGKVRFATSGRNIVKKQNLEESKVRFLSDERNSGYNKERMTTDNADIGLGLTTVNVPSLNKAENDGEDGESPTVEISEPFDDKSDASDETIDPDLLSPSSDDEEERKRSRKAKKKGDNVFGLRNATIDFATGEVRTRAAVVRTVSPQS